VFWKNQPGHATTGPMDIKQKANQGITRMFEKPNPNLFRLSFKEPTGHVHNR
jgi:hypothetical protein